MASERCSEKLACISILFIDLFEYPNKSSSYHDVKLKPAAARGRSTAFHNRLNQGDTERSHKIHITERSHRINESNVWSKNSRKKNLKEKFI